jgi:hypothetical protein
MRPSGTGEREVRRGAARRETPLPAAHSLLASVGSTEASHGRRAASVTVVSTRAGQRPQRRPSNLDPLDLVEVDLVTSAVAELRHLR